MNPLGLVSKWKEAPRKTSPMDVAQAGSWRKSVMYGKGEPLSEREKLADWNAMWLEASGWTPEMMYQAAIRDPVHGVLPYGGWDDPRIQQAYMATSLAPLSIAMKGPRIRATAKPPEKIGGVIDRFPNLTPAQRKVEEEFGNWILQDPERAIKAAIEKSGNVVNVDEYRKLWPAYEANRAEFSVAVHEPASYLSKLVYQRLLEQPTPAGKDPVVVFTAGGTGAGKTTAVRRVPEAQAIHERADIIFDSNLQNVESAAKKITAAHDNGRGVVVLYVAREPVEAMTNGALKRATNPNSPDFGRTVPTDIHAATHVGSYNAVGELDQRFADHPRFALVVIDNTGPQPRPVTYGEIPKEWYNGLDERLQKAIDLEVKNGKISPAVAEGFRPQGLRGGVQGGGPRETQLDPGPQRAQALGDFKVTKGGVYVGAPPGVKSQADIDRLASEYADRAVRAMESGVQPGWFYERGSRAIAEVATDPQWAARFADVNAITSSEAPVRSNVGWAIQGLEQHAAGLPIQTGKYPTEASGSIRKILEGQDPHLGEKRHLYGAGLKGQGGLAPNDRWEIRSMGYNADSAGPAQHAFMHRVREVAIRKLREKTGKDLTPHEIQELNWATTRADQIGITIQKSATDTIQDAIPYYTFQHSWESVPGSTSKHLEQLARLGPGAWSEYHERVKSVILTPEGKDRLIEAMGGRLQRPAFDVPGVYKGQVSPGTQSRSLVYRTSEGGLSPASMARVEATEAARALILGQDAYAGHIPGKSPSVTQADTAVLKIGRTITSEEAGRLQGKLDEIYGPGSTAIVPTLEGTNVLNLGAEDFGKVFNARGKEIEAAIGSKAEYALAKRAGIYEELQWSSEPRSQATQFWAGRGQLTNVPRGATAMMLEKLNAAPGVRQAADSAPMRQLAGEVADMYLTLKKTALVPNDGIIRVLTAWKDGGLPAVEALVQKGLAPAIVLSILGGMWAEGSEQGE